MTRLPENNKMKEQKDEQRKVPQITQDQTPPSSAADENSSPKEALTGKDQGENLEARTGALAKWESVRPPGKDMWHRIANFLLLSTRTC